MPNDATKQDIIDIIDFSKTSLAKPEYLIELIKSFSSRNPYSVCFNIANHLILTYFCKHHVKTPADIGILVVPLLESRHGYEPFQNYMSDEEKRIVFKSFNVGNLVDIMNMIETNPDVLNAVIGDTSAAERFQRVFERFSQHDLDLFLSETGADKFVNFIKIQQAKRREELEKEKQAEAEWQKRQREIEAEKQKRQKEKEEQEAEREKKFNAVVSKRLQKLAYNLDSLGVWKYSMKLPWYRNPISKEDISGLSPDDPGVKNMFGALVRAQKHVNTPERLAYFNNMLELMSGQFKPKTCLYNTSVVDMMAAAGVKNFNDKDKKPFKTQEAIARYRHILWVLRRYPAVFGVDGYNVAKDFTDYPHSKSVSIFDYDNDKELQKLEAKSQFYKEESSIANELSYTRKREIFKRVGLAIRTVKNKKNYKNTLKEINDRSK